MRGMPGPSTGYRIDPDKMQALFDLVCTVLTNELSKQEVSPAMVQAALRFLESNDTAALPVPGSKLQDLADKAPPFKIAQG